jgi:hypothetical protein
MSTTDKTVTVEQIGSPARRPGDRNIFKPRSKSGFVNASGGR